MVLWPWGDIPANNSFHQNHRCGQENRAYFWAPTAPERGRPLEISPGNRRINNTFQARRGLTAIDREVSRGTMSNRPRIAPNDELVVQESKPKLKRPRLYKVILLNDDYTPMEFVVVLLERIFNKPRETAVQIMLHVHQKGMGVCGIYPRDVAESKVKQVMDFARDHQHPLQCAMEPE